MLSSVYKVDNVIIPNLREKQFIEFPILTLEGESAWVQRICDSAINEYHKSRGVLIVCETINYALKIHDKMKTIHT